MSFQFDNLFAQRLFNQDINFRTGLFYVVACTGTVPATASNYGGLANRVNPITGANGNYAHQQLVRANATPALINVNRTWMDFEDAEWVNIWSATSVSINHFALLQGQAVTFTNADPVIMSWSVSPAFVVPTIPSNQNLRLVFNVGGVIETAFV